MRQLNKKESLWYKRKQIPRRLDAYTYFTERNIYYRLNKNTIILVNTLSGAVDLVDNKEFAAISRFINQKKPVQNNPRLFRKLLERGYLFKGPKEEERIFKMTCLTNYRQSQYYLTKSGKALRKKETLAFYIYPTISCNFNCPYCYSQLDPKQKAKLMTKDQAAQVFKSIKSIVKSRSRGKSKAIALIYLLGGEPFLPATYQTMEKIFQELKAAKYQMQITTNGYYLLEFRDLIKRFKSTIASFQISLDGPKKIHDQRRPLKSGQGTFDRITAGIDFLVKQRLDLFVRTNLDEDNINYLSEYLDFIQDKGWHLKRNLHLLLGQIFDTMKKSKKNYHYLDSESFLDAIGKILNKHKKIKNLDFFTWEHGIDHLASATKEKPRSIQLLEKWQGKKYPLPSLRSEIKFKYCSACELATFVFLPDGVIYPCPPAAGIKQLALGKYFPRLKLFKNKCQQWQERNILKMPKCYKCSIATLCGRGCPVNSFHKYGAINKGSCAGTQASISNYFQYLKNLARGIKS